MSNFLLPSSKMPNLAVMGALNYSLLIINNRAQKKGYFMTQRLKTKTIPFLFLSVLSSFSFLSAAGNQDSTSLVAIPGVNGGKEIALMACNKVFEDSTSKPSSLIYQFEFITKDINYFSDKATGALKRCLRTSSDPDDTSSKDKNFNEISNFLDGSDSNASALVTKIRGILFHDGGKDTDSAINNGGYAEQKGEGIEDTRTTYKGKRRGIESVKIYNRIKETDTVDLSLIVDQSKVKKGKNFNLRIDDEDGLYIGFIENTFSPISRGYYIKRFYTNKLLKVGVGKSGNEVFKDKRVQYEVIEVGRANFAEAMAEELAHSAIENNKVPLMILSKDFLMQIHGDLTKEALGDIEKGADAINKRCLVEESVPKIIHQGGFGSYVSNVIKGTSDEIPAVSGKFNIFKRILQDAASNPNNSESSQYHCYNSRWKDQEAGFTMFDGIITLATQKTQESTSTDDAELTDKKENTRGSDYDSIVRHFEKILLQLGYPSRRNSTGKFIGNAHSIINVDPLNTKDLSNTSAVDRGLSRKLGGMSGFNMMDVLGQTMLSPNYLSEKYIGQGTVTVTKDDNNDEKYGTENQIGLLYANHCAEIKIKDSADIKDESETSESSSESSASYFCGNSKWETVEKNIDLGNFNPMFVNEGLIYNFSSMDDQTNLNAHLSMASTFMAHKKIKRGFLMANVFSEADYTLNSHLHHKATKIKDLWNQLRARVDHRISRTVSSEIKVSPKVYSLSYIDEVFPENWTLAPFSSSNFETGAMVLMSVVPIHTFAKVPRATSENHILGYIATDLGHIETLPRFINGFEGNSIVNDSSYYETKRTRVYENTQWTIYAGLILDGFKFVAEMISAPVAMFSLASEVTPALYIYKDFSRGIEKGLVDFALSENIWYKGDNKNESASSKGYNRVVLDYLTSSKSTLRIKRSKKSTSISNDLKTNVMYSSIINNVMNGDVDKTFFNRDFTEAMHYFARSHQNLGGVDTSGAVGTKLYSGTKILDDNSVEKRKPLSDTFFKHRNANIDHIYSSYDAARGWSFLWHDGQWDGEGDPIYKSPEERHNIQTYIDDSMLFLKEETRKGSNGVKNMPIKSNVIYMFNKYLGGN
jgi:hypothetical protein